MNTEIEVGMPKFVRNIIIGLVIIVLGLLSTCTFKSVQPDAGVEAVLVDKPIFGSGGIRKEVVKTGRKYVWFTTNAIMINMLPTVVAVKFDDLASSNRFLLDFNAQVRIKVTDSYSLVSTVGDYGGYWDRTLDPTFKAIVRDAVKKYTMEQLMTDPALAKDLDKEITDALVGYAKANKFPISILDVTLGQAKPNQEIIAQLNATSAELQRKGQMTAKQAAEEERKKAEEKAALADNAYREKIGYTSSEFLQLKKVELMANACKEAANCVVYNGTAPLLTSK